VVELALRPVRDQIVAAKPTADLFEKRPQDEKAGETINSYSHVRQDTAREEHGHVTRSDDA